MKNLSLGDLLRRPESGAFLGLVFVLAFFVVFGSIEFLKPAGAASWLNVAANLGIVAIPVGLLMISGELDISIGAMIPAGALTVAIISGYYGMPIWLGIIGALCLGVLVGLINGFLVIRTVVPSLIVTLGTLFAVQGLILGFSVLLTGTTSVALSPAQSGPIAKFLFGQFIGGSFQVSIIWWLLLTAIYVFYVHYSPFGNWIFAMGGDRVSARNAGIPTDKLTVTLFVLSSVSASFVGVCQAILFNVAQVSAGMTFIFNSIIAVVVGGVLLTGGFGSVIGIFLGTITFAIVNQGIYFTAFDRNWSSLIIGVMLLLAVLMNNTFRVMALTYSPKKK
ncbi:ABC transporter permease [Agrobacterium radiobacter]|uniref:Xylose transport system permease protein XylH n=3 Tax=Agrobacterium tumefaciens complex TaxID=1183400 RepID=A0A822V7J4_AGRTU|nr:MULTISPECIES: ABC transporter permease [Agrobacterium tumefaciens complex]MCP2136881.1 simple sugar transport system permease protein [Rhizobium sp. SLBN-94]AYM83577.1 simple sugar transport system permease protein [Agrobacterium tumefaciens]EHH05681.1 sugar ABC transporter [Agrobacterium tumefaciens CCNWGS0286]KWT78120.1 ABC transporter permease [Agrobacterium radiobacter]KWT88331.1 ABC transporter permease [Agrobacterium tumefaciens str. B6]